VKLGLITTGILQHGFEAGLDVAQRLELDAIEIGTGGFHPTTYADPGALLADPAALARWREAIAERGLDVSALAIHGAPLAPDPAEAALYARQFADTCRLAERIGVDRLTLLAGLPAGAEGDTTPCWVVTPFPPYNVAALAWQWERRLLPYWRETAKVAESHGCRLCFEMSPSDMVFNPASLLRLRDEIGPVIGCNFDPSHLFWQQIDPIEAIHVLGPAIYHVHAKDTRTSDREVRLNGVLDPKPHAERATRSWLFRTVGYGHDRSFWCDFVSALRMVGYDDVVSIEHEDDLIEADEGLAKATQLLRGVLLERPVGLAWWQAVGAEGVPDAGVSRSTIDNEDANGTM
jgi:sugar phosphate isomerase/epimerase